MNAQTCAFAILTLPLAHLACAQPVVNPANCHAYEAVAVQGTWEQMRAAAALRTYQGVAGHLATVTAAQENNFLLSAFGTQDSFALGGVQVGGPEPAGGWTWITGELWAFTDWDAGEPNNFLIHGQRENRLAWKTGTVGRWNDVAGDVNEGPGPGQYRMNGYFVEFDLTLCCDPIDFNGDGLFPDTADIDDFLSVFSGGPCSTGTCGDIDFNNDGLFPDTLDIDSLLSVFSGGPCLV